MGRSEAEDAGGLTPVKDDNEAAPIFAAELYSFDYNPCPQARRAWRNGEPVTADSGADE